MGGECEFRAILSYIARAGPAQATVEDCLKKEKKIKKVGDAMLETEGVQGSQ